METGLARKNTVNGAPSSVVATRGNPRPLAERESFATETREATEAELARVRAELNETSDDLTRARGDNQRLREKLRKAEQEAIELRSAVDAHTASLATAQRQQIRASQRQAAQEREIAELQSLCERAQNRVRDTERTRQGAIELKNSLQTQCDAQAVQLRELAQGLATANAKLEKALGENSALSVRARELESQGTFRTDAADRRMQEIEQQDARLRNYARSLNHVRQELALAARNFADEIQSAKTLHPLKDYLALTTFEINKIETKLKATPTASPDRAGLEAAIAQFIEQRDFLTSLLEASRRELEGQARQVLGLVEWASMTATVPPPPPASALAKSRLIAQGLGG